VITVLLFVIIPTWAADPTSSAPISKGKPALSEAIADFIPVNSSAHPEARREQWTTKPWFAFDFVYRRKNYYVVFIQSLTFHDKDFDCHACRPVIGAATYIERPSGWQMLKMQTDHLKGIGTWGIAQRPQDTFTLTLSPQVIAIATAFGDGGQGYWNSGVDLLAFNGQAWAYRGYIDQHGDNSGTCDEPNTPDPMDLGPCFEFNGDVRVTSHTSHGLSDILVKMHGTDYGPHGHMVPAVDHVYKFNGKMYELASPRQ